MISSGNVHLTAVGTENEAYRRPAAAQHRSFMLEQCLPFTLTRLVDLVDPDFLVP